MRRVNCEEMWANLHAGQPGVGLRPPVERGHTNRPVKQSQPEYAMYDG